MSRAKWKDANLRPEPGYSMLPSLYDAMWYRGLLLNVANDLDTGDFWGDEWEIQSERTGQIVMAIRADEGRAYEIATKLAEMLDWEKIDEADWQTMSLDPVFLSFIGEHYEEVTISIVETDDRLESIVPYSDHKHSAGLHG